MTRPPMLGLAQKTGRGTGEGLIHKWCPDSLRPCSPTVSRQAQVHTIHGHCHETLAWPAAARAPHEGGLQQALPVSCCTVGPPHPPPWTRHWLLTISFRGHSSMANSQQEKPSK